MRKISKNYASPPAPLTGAAANATLVAIVTAGSYSGTNYKAPAVITALNRLYHHKCAYCEAHITAVSYQHVEHYRPKNAVSAADLAGVVHTGYYWLGNEWSNLLIACTWCNGSGRKGTRFPLSNPLRRVTNPPALLPPAPGTYNIPANHITHLHLRPERPLIINPETTNPSLHLKIEKTGILKERNSSPQGSKTIEILKLNRDGLLVKRKEIIDRTINKINKAIKAHKRAADPLTPAQFELHLEDLFDEIVQGTTPKMEYTMVYREILKNFDVLILTSRKIQVVFRPQVKAIFDAYST
jgi:hypothetical protein